ncbi:PEP-CTERM sorting domain-containing protein [Microcoleus sp. OTE_8_concoct_300]|uniref:PEP-CTERM sorting domain-containing protein n=1 Tax=Microcoleus sp. OTE_8_concoct_300 TaxID=2964710 RepID=UPI00403F0718
MSVFPIFIKSSSNLLALTSVSVYLEDVKEKKPIPNLHPIFIQSSSNLIALTSVSVYLEDVKEKNQIPLYLKIKVPTMKFPLNLVKSLLAVAGVAAVSAISAAPASAINFSNITGGDPVGDAYANNFGLTVENQGGLAVFNIFNFGNPSATDMFIAGVFFDDNGSLSSSSAPWTNVNNFGDVRFSGGASNAQLPQGGKNFTTDYAFFSDNGDGNKYGIQAGEKLGLAWAASYNSVISDLTSGALRVGLHVQALPNGASDSYITSNSGNTQDTPEPLTMLAAGAAVGFGTMFKKQRAQAQKAQ